MISQGAHLCAGDHDIDRPGRTLRRIPISIGSVSLLFIMIRKGAATKVTSLLYLTPPTTAIMAWLLFDEPLTWMMAAGIVLTMGAVVLVNQKVRQ